MPMSFVKIQHHGIKFMIIASVMNCTFVLNDKHWSVWIEDVALMYIDGMRIS